MTASPFAYVIALVVLLCFLAAAITAVIIREGNPSAAAPLITTLLGLFGPTIGILVLVIRQQHNITAIDNAQLLLNSHLTQHEQAAAATGQVITQEGSGNVPSA